jgi:hypothetical protein
MVFMNIMGRSVLKNGVTIVESGKRVLEVNFTEIVIAKDLRLPDGKVTIMG